VRAVLTPGRRASTTRIRPSPVRAALAGYAPAPGVKLGHPYFMGPHPCTMLVEEVEAIRAPIAERDDWSLVAAKLEAIGAMADAYGTLI